MKNTVRVLIFFFLGIIFTVSLLSQPFGPQNLGPTFPTDDQVVKNIYKEAMDSSRLPMHAHELLDVIGPRLIGSPGIIKGIREDDQPDGARHCVVALFVSTASRRCQALGYCVVAVVVQYSNAWHRDTR